MRGFSRRKSILHRILRGRRGTAALSNTFRDKTMDLLFLFSTALAVSIDSFVCGFSLGLNARRKLPVVLGIALTVFLMCLITDALGTSLSGILNEDVAALGGLVLIGVAIFNLMPRREGKNTAHDPFRQSVVVGLAVGLDGACANFSLALMGYTGVVVPALIALLHAAMIYLGISLSDTNALSFFKKADFLSPLILALLGLYKLSALL